MFGQPIKKSLNLKALTLSVILTFVAGLNAGQLFAGELSENVTSEDPYGVTNPEELSMTYYVKNMKRNLNRGHDFVCSLGYFATKSGDHKTALKIFRTCAKRGNQGAKIWMSYMHQNGYGVKKDPKASTDWVKESANEGYSIGKYNYGVALLKGYGVKRDFNAGKSLIDEVAANGDVHAIELQQNEYNPDVVTPDADQTDKDLLF